MSRRRTPTIVRSVTPLLGAWLLFGSCSRGPAATPVAAWVGIEVDGSGTAEVGRLELEAGTPFRLHAILQAETADGSTLYYGEADEVRIDGERSQVRPYDLGGASRVLWFTVEGIVPYLALEPGQGAERFKLQEFFRPEWGRAWSVPGVLDSQHDDQLEIAVGERPRPFGTQRYQVWIEILDTESSLISRQRFRSAGVEDLLADPDALSTVMARLPSQAGPASALFGLTEIEPPPEPSPELLAALTELADKRLAFTRLTALRDHIRAAGHSLDDLRWRRLDLDAAPPWGVGGVAAGDLLRVGGRMVVLYRDDDQGGTLDSNDLCFDFERGPEIRPLAAVFVGSGEVEWASLVAPAAM